MRQRSYFVVDSRRQCGEFLTLNGVPPSDFEIRTGRDKAGTIWRIDQVPDRAAVAMQCEQSSPLLHIPNVHVAFLARRGQAFAIRTEGDAGDSKLMGIEGKDVAPRAD